MKIKKFEHQKVEKCKLSKKPIDTEKEKYAIILECEGNEIETVGFYKAELLNGLIKGNLEKINKELTNRYQNLAQGLMGSLKKVAFGEGPKKEFIIGGVN